MKKITLLMALFFVFTTNIYAQFPQGFEGATFPPTGWASFRGTNGLGTAFDWSSNTVAANISSGTKAAYVRYEVVTTGELAEDWLVTPQFTVTAPNVLLAFFDRNEYAPDWGTEYTIRVSTTSQTNIASFTTIDTKHETDLGLTMTQRSVDLSAYVGQSIYVAFVMTQNDGDNWAIDDVSLLPNVSVPDCVTLVAPADASTVPVGNITFSWAAATTGDPATSYDLYYGLTSTTVTNLFGNFTTTTADAILNNFDTTFYWKIVPKNIAGSQTNCPVWSFTTQSPPGYCLNAPNGQWPTTDFTPSVCNGQTAETITANGYAGEYSVVNVTFGETYVFSSSVPTDFITISTDDGATADAYGTTPLTWVSSIDGPVRFYTHLDDQCGDEAVDRTRAVTCGVATCTPPTVTFATVSNCPTPTFNVTADITDMGSAGSITVTDDQGSASQQTLTAGLVTFGPYPSGTQVILTVANDDDASCTVVGTALTDICAPANDECINAVVIACGDTLTNQTTSGATGGTPTSCIGTIGDDVWYKFTGDGLQNTITATATGTESPQLEVYESNDGTCGGFAAGNCFAAAGTGEPDPTVVFVSTLGTIYYIHVGSWINGDPAVDFDLSITCGTPPPPPVNDDCSGATVLTLGATFADNAVIGTNAGATDSPVADPTCSSYGGSDVWFSAVVPTSGSITFETASDDDSITDTAIEVYTGDCATLNVVDCNDDIDVFGGNFFSMLELTGLTPGETVYLRLFTYQNAETGTFQISAYDASLATDTFDNSNFAYFPNPVKNVLNLTNSKNIDKVQVVNILGQEVIAKSLNATQSQIDMSNLPSGTYLVRVTSDNQVKTIKVIKE